MPRAAGALEARRLDAASRARWLRSSLPLSLAVGVVQGFAFLCSAAALARTSFVHALCASNVVSVWLAVAAVSRWTWARVAQRQKRIMDLGERWMNAMKEQSGAPKDGQEQDNGGAGSQQPPSGAPKDGEIP